MMVQYIITIIIISISLLYVVIKVWRSVFPARKPTTSSFCSGCDGCRLKDYGKADKCTGYRGANRNYLFNLLKK
ncbi:MAG: hypothetical protein JXB00_13900 [Bacteroidales bacterium]|nr:hypothetical protein [Bacteroidales bacterium]